MTPRLPGDARRAILATWMVGMVAGIAGCRGGLESVTLRVGHRLNPAFTDSVTVCPGERFQIGDTEFTGKVDRFLPDFALEDGKAISRSEEVRNPAVHVRVYQGRKVIEEAWAFPSGGPPHMSPKNFLYFVIVDLKLAPLETTGTAGGADETSPR